MFIKCSNLTHSISSIVHRLKGTTSFRIRKKYPFLKKYKAFWSPSYFCESIGNMSEKVIRKYIRNQKVNLKPTYKYSNMIRKHLRGKAFVSYGQIHRRPHNSVSIKHIDIDEQFRPPTTKKYGQVYQKHLQH